MGGDPGSQVVTSTWDGTNIPEQFREYFDVRDYSGFDFGGWSRPRARNPDGQSVPVPEPAAPVLVGTGLAGLAVMRIRP